MDELTKNLTSVAWWVSVFVAGIVTNFLVAYSKPVIDSIRGKYSAKRAAVNATRKAEFEAKVRLACVDAEYRAMLRHSNLSSVIRVTFLLLVLMGISAGLFLLQVLPPDPPPPTPLLLAMRFVLGALGALTGVAFLFGCRELTIGVEERVLAASAKHFHDVWNATEEQRMTQRTTHPTPLPPGAAAKEESEEESEEQEQPKTDA